MNPDVFFENFELLADAPNAVQKLRELILQLAVMGKLVPQDPNDEPVPSFFERVDLEKEYSIKKSDKLLQNWEKKISYKLPTGWKIFQPGEICQFSTGKLNSNQSVPDGMYPFFTCSKETYRIDTYSFDCEALLLAGNNAQGIYSLKYYKGKFDAYQRTYIITTNKDLVDYMYLKYLLETKLEELKKNSLGTLTKYLTLKILLNLILPIPPLPEQKRIVSKVEELMILCDKLEARRQKKQEIQSKLNGAALDRMLSAENHEEFEQYWQRICESFDLLYDNPENVEKLRQAILQLAVQGKLVPQNLEDEPVSVLIEKIKAEKKTLIKEKKIKQIKVLPIKNEDIPFELPDGWEFVRMGDIAEKLGAGSTPLGGNSVYQESGIKFIRSQNVWNNGLKLENVAYISSEIHKKMNGTFVEPGDILLNITGASIGRSSLVPDNFDEGNVNQHVSIVRLIDKTIREYLHLCIISPYIQNLIMSEQVGISREGLSMSRLKEFLIPLPPYEEQKCIVEKVEQLMGLCDELEAKLRKERKDIEKLMEAVVKGLLEGADTEKTELEKSISLQVAAIQLK